MNDQEFFCLHSDLCKTLANAKRQAILSALRDGEVSVSEIVERTGIPQPTVSQHLATMRTKGVVVARREGSRVLYRVSNPKIVQAFDLITEVMRETLESQTKTVEPWSGSSNENDG
ncbi:metalloregulator ArsR/SmtB family transcription factor [Coriobacteriia bacterium Es71-Z0120]|uniref:ArsR/SmtB family transcription factor n=1 Tax=Parvivirga hydrogeniphila TaxID=2939460 RepID=UPI002260E128|nr:metalloregulator ArsR/SmtB family transcription factor [Parvivirga hydrogeniphila]MCL4078744.1 metalloregulator ArsR/SmtB family transcription factor [Parvivirga hydrogeniphila]